MRNLLTIALIVAGAAFAAPAMASEAIPQSLAQRLDNAPAAYSMTAAKERRLMMMQEAQRQQRYGRPGPGYGRPAGPPPGYYGRPPGPRPGYGPRPGWGPPPQPWAPPPPAPPRW